MTVIGGTINWARRAIHTIVKDDRDIPLIIYQDHLAKNAHLMSCLFPNISTGSKHKKTLDIATYSDGHSVISIVDKMESEDFVLTSARRWPVCTFTVCLIRWQWMLSWCTGFLLVKLLSCKNSSNSLQRSLELRRMYSVVAYKLFVIFSKYMIWLGGRFCRICLLILIYQCN